MQLAKALGGAVTAVCSTRNVEQACSIGADHVIDYTKDDFTRQGQRYDLILAVNGYHYIFAYRRILHPTGWLLRTSVQEMGLFCTMERACLPKPS